jgi:hypothetical protein
MYPNKQNLNVERQCDYRKCKAQENAEENKTSQAGKSRAANYNFIIIYFNCKWVFTLWQCNTIRHNKQITHHTK